MLKVEKLAVSYGEIKAIRDVSLEIKDKECVAIVGANGAGKSTLLRSIMGLKDIGSGSVSFENKDISNLPTYKISEIGISFVPEGARVFPKISVYGNLMLGAYKEKDRNRIKKRLEYVYSLFSRLKERQNQIAGTLSGGERQMLSMARALMGKPKLMMIDEISLGLMPKLVDTVFEIVDGLHQSGITIFLSEQNAHKAAEISDRVYILELGKIVKETDKKGILSDPQIRKAYLGVKS